MTLRKKGGRAIRVAGHDLRFSVFRKGVRGCPDCDRLHVIVCDASRRGSVVRVCVDDAWGSDVAITPRTIAVAAARALERGWSPGQGEGVFLAVRLSDLGPPPARTA